MDEWDKNVSQYEWTAKSEVYEPAQPVKFEKCFCCNGVFGKDGKIILEVNSKRATFCIECQKDYINRNVEDFKKFMSLRKIQLGK